MREAITYETDKDTRPDDLNNYKFHLCICEKTDLFRNFGRKSNLSNK